MSRLSIAVVLIAVAALSLHAQQQQTMNTAAGASTGIAAGVTSKNRQQPLTTIQGNALDSTNAQLRGAPVRLRDARFGRIVDTQLTDKSGLFAFRAVEPGSYIVELLANDNSILAASQLLNVNAGDAVSAVVKLPFRAPQAAGLLAPTTSSARVIATQALASGIVAIIATKPVSPNQ
jgi:hypothetical protein